MADYVDVNGVRIHPDIGCETIAGDRRRAMLNPEAVTRQKREIATALAASLNAAKRPQSAAALDLWVEDFYALYPHRAVPDNEGGSSFNACLWLYVIGRALAPQLIIESGTWRGQSSWFWRAACPEAEIHSFDVSHAFLEARAERVHYHLGDWTTAELSPVDPAHSLVFFDDHISQAARAVQAAERGFTTALFDDNLSAHQLHAIGSPPVPTIAMVLDETLDPAHEMRWTRKGKDYRYIPDGALIALARAQIEGATDLADLAPITRYAPQSGLTLVTLTRR